MIRKLRTHDAEQMPDAWPGVDEAPPKKRIDMVV